MRACAWIVWVGWAVGLAAHAQSASTGTIRGRVVDLQTGEAIAKVSVSAGKQESTTGEDGQFTLSALPGGDIELHVYTVGYALLKRTVSVPAGGTADVELSLGRDLPRDTQQVTVNAGPFETAVPDAISEYTLNAKELEDLSSVLANDPFRAVNALPGVSANQDFYASFAVRGAGPDHVGVYMDGVLIDHPAYTLEDSGNLGSLSVVNGDLAGEVTLLSGAFPPSYGERTGAALDVRLREGARDRVNTRFVADVLGAALTSEGPLGRGGKTSWIVSGRRSYLAYLLDRLGLSGGLTLNYDDVTGRVTREVTPQHAFSLLASLGGTSAERSQNTSAGQAASSFTHGAAQHGMSVGRWQWTPSSTTMLQTEAFWTHDHEHDTNAAGAVDLETSSDVAGLRSDWTGDARSGQRWIAGVEVRRPDQQRASYTQWNYAAHTLSPSLLPLDAYARSAWQAGAYAEDRLDFREQRVSVTGGLRWAAYTPNDAALWLPHASVVARVTHATSLNVGWGQYAQPPTMAEMYGAFGNASLHAERATHASFSVDQFLGEKVRLHAEIYNRQEHGDIYSPLTEFRLLANGQVGFPVLGPVEGNNLKSYARGFEVSLQRRSANKLAGWISYARSYSKYWQPGTVLSFAGDFDQRNSVSAYAAYRLTRTVDVSADVRYGTGMPIAGFLGSGVASTSSPNATMTYRLGTARNALRNSDYLRTDARVNKVFTARRFNLTVHGEIENITRHVNPAFHDFRVLANVATSHQETAKRQSTLPFLPAAGFTFEF